MNIRALIDSVGNGGVISYFYNSGADVLTDCRTALVRLDARAVLAQVDRVASLFGDTVPDTMEARNQVIDAWPDNGDQDAMLDEVDDILMPLMTDLENKLLAFITAAGVLEG